MRALLLLALAGAVVGVAFSCGDSTTPASATNDAATSSPEAAPQALCVDGKSSLPYPPEPYELGVLGTAPALTFDGPQGPVTLQSYFEPCAPRSRVLVVRSSAGWCGPCLWHASHTKRLMEDPKLAGRVVLLDLLIADEDNSPATVAQLGRWREKIDAPSTLAIDPRFSFGPAILGSHGPLPAYVFIDTRTMRILSTMSDPAPAALAWRLETELADLDRRPRPPALKQELVDELFTENEIDLVHGMQLVSTPPPDPTNEYADSPAAAALGKKLFSDKLLSPSGTVSCATCHDPARDFTDGASQSIGVASVDRNSPALALAAHSRWQFWDGRADTLWMQALGPFEDAKEMGSSRVYVARQIALRYAVEYGAVFGAKHPLPNLALFPANGKPGDPKYDALSDVDKEKVTRVFVNAGKAIAAFERTLRVKPNALDRYAAGDLGALDAQQKHALVLFLRNGCVQCHWGPRLTDDAFHTLRFPTGRQDGKADPGREDGLLKLAAAEFVASSKWSDAPAAAKTFLVDNPTALGAFKTPTLRGLPTSAPYGHGGTFKTLHDVSDHYGTRGLEHADPRAVGTTERWVPNFDSNVRHDLPFILDVMKGETVTN